MTTLLLVRHGLSLANREKFFAGQADVPLLPMGQLQARATGAFLREHYAAHKVYASDLVRAGETGQILAEILGCPLETDKGLREIYAGAWQEKTFDYMTEHYPEGYGVWRQDIGKAQCPQGESVAEMGLRVREALTRICRDNPGKTLVIATHATATEQGNPADSGTAVTDAEDDEAEVFCCGDCTLCGLCDEDDDDSHEDEEERIDELLHKLLEAVKDATDAMDSVLKVADALKELTGENIFSQMMG